MANAQTMIRQVRTSGLIQASNVPPPDLGLPGDAASHQGLHLGLRHHDPRRPTGGRVTFPALLQPPPHHKTVAALEDRHHLSLLRSFRLQLSVQPDLHLPLLSDVGGGKFQGQILGLCHDVRVRSCCDDLLRIFC